MPEYRRPPDFLTIRQVADRFGRSVSWVRRQHLIRVGLGRQPLYHRRACEAFEVARRDHQPRLLRQVQTAAVAAYYRLPYERSPAITLALQKMHALFDRAPKRYRPVFRVCTGMRAAVRFAHQSITQLTRRFWYVNDRFPSSMPEEPPPMPVPQCVDPSLWHGLREMVIRFAQRHYEAERKQALERFDNRFESDEYHRVAFDDPPRVEVWT